MYQMLPRSTKVVIVGGGVIGCSVAYHLTKFGNQKINLHEEKNPFMRRRRLSSIGRSYPTRWP